jgi:hypothetical protein
VDNDESTVAPAACDPLYNTLTGAGVTASGFAIAANISPTVMAKRLRGITADGTGVLSPDEEARIAAAAPPS